MTLRAAKQAVSCVGPARIAAQRLLRRLRGIAPVMIVGGLSSCANVHTLTVTPSLACPGEPVTISWVANGRTALAVIPLPVDDRVPGRAVDYCVDALASAAVFNPEPSRGTLTVLASQDTAYFVESTGWFGNSAPQCKTLFVDRVLPLAATPACIGVREAHAQLIRHADSRWSSGARAGLVENESPVPLTVRHDGRSTTLAARATTDIFSGTDPNSAWQVDYSWQEGPPCGKAGTPVPSSLSLRVHPFCASAGGGRP